MLVHTTLHKTSRNARYREETLDSAVLAVHAVQDGENGVDALDLACGGVDYAVSPAVTLRAGVQHAITPTRNGDRDARVPDSDEIREQLALCRTWLVSQSLCAGG